MAARAALLLALVLTAAPAAPARPAPAAPARPAPAAPARPAPAAPARPAEAAPAAPAPAPPARAPAVLRFAVTFSGHGSYGTVYHSTPPNPGGRADVNDAHDTSSQRWSLRFRGGLALPACAGCPGLRGPTGGAGGTEAARAGIDHTHHDGLFAADDMAVRCRIAANAAPGATRPPSVEVRYAAGGRAIALTAHDPASAALAALPQQCPGQGDSLDGLLDFYATPGFSFAPGWGEPPWFTSRTVFVRVALLRRRRRLALLLRGAPAGAPPGDCAVRQPSFERCRTGGAWSGVLVLTARG